MVTLSSIYLKIYKTLLASIISINLIGILIIRFLLPKEKSITYDLTVSTMLIIICGIFLIISFNFYSVNFDKTRKTLHFNKARRSFIVDNTNIIDIKRVFIFLCKINYKENNSQKSIIFLPSIRLFFPLLDFPDKIKKLIS